MNILSLGDLLLDILMRFDPRSGEADTGPEAVQISPGGSAANFAVQAARLGAKVRFVSRVGRDWAGEMLVRTLEAEGVTASVKAIEEEPSGRVLVMIDPDGHRRMWSYPGASSTLSPDDLDPTWFDGLNAFHLTGYSLLRDGPRDAALTALLTARNKGVGGRPICTLDPNPSHLIADYGPARFREMLAQLRFDMLFPNLEEGRLLTGKEAPEDIAASLLEVSPLVALTLGTEGCVVAYEDQMVRVPPFPVEAVADATGAGDAFAAAFVVEYLESRNVTAAATAANRFAASVVSRPGGR